MLLPGRSEIDEVSYGIMRDPEEDMVRYMPGVFMNFEPTLNNAASSVGVANGAIFSMLRVLQPVTAKRIWYNLAASGGNLDVGVYQMDSTQHTRLWSRGAFASPGTGYRDLANNTGTAVLQPYTPYSVWVSSSAVTATLNRCVTTAINTGSNMRIYPPGMVHATMTVVDSGTTTAAHPLPATIANSAVTPVSWTPWVGLARE